MTIKQIRQNFVYGNYDKAIFIESLGGCNLEFRLKDNKGNLTLGGIPVWPKDDKRTFNLKDLLKDPKFESEYWTFEFDQRKWRGRLSLKIHKVPATFKLPHCAPIITNELYAVKGVLSTVQYITNQYNTRKYKMVILPEGAAQDSGFDINQAKPGRIYFSHFITEIAAPFNLNRIKELIDQEGTPIYVSNSVVSIDHELISTVSYETSTKFIITIKNRVYRFKKQGNILIGRTKVFENTGGFLTEVNPVVSKEDF